MPAETLPALNRLDMAVTPAGEQRLLTAIAPLQQRLAAHPLYRSIGSLEALRTFMQSHVYAVWDFMSLLKALQRALTCVELPWRPVGSARSRRLVNEIVLGEESDLYQDESLSHFELYLRAMQSCGASTASVEQLLASVAQGSSLSEALTPAPAEAAAFVRSTFAVIATGEVHRIAAAFTFGREDLIPEMFSAFVRELDQQMPGRIAPFRYYLERHIEMDGDEHGPMALAMLRELCPTTRHWEEATVSAQAALEARLALWDGVHARLYF
jgi:pyrroloquinoline quinone (PQQ) biosynthesis protein C